MLKPKSQLKSALFTACKFKLNSTPLFSISPTFAITWLEKFAPAGCPTKFNKSEVTFL